jgi:hypothetical protein
MAEAINSKFDWIGVRCKGISVIYIVFCRDGIPARGIIPNIAIPSRCRFQAQSTEATGWPIVHEYASVRCCAKCSKSP